MSRRVAFYLRQSEDVAEGIARQRERCTSLAAAKGWEVVEGFEDNEVSASKSRGPKTAWGRMLAAGAAGQFDIIVAVDLDRLLRGISDLVTLIDLKLAVVTVDGEIDLSTADGEFRATMLAAVARFEVRRKAERQRRANLYRVGQGLPVPGGRRRFGFEADHLTLREVEAEWVRTMFSRVAKGASLASMAKALNEAGVPCVTKGKWNPARVRKIMVNPAYVGSVIHHGKPHPAAASVPVVVDRELFEAVQLVMLDPTRRKVQTTTRTALMGGLGACGTCGAPLISAGTKSKGVNIPTYACSRVKGGQTDGKGHPSIRRAILDGLVRDAVVAAFVVGNPSDFDRDDGSGLEAVMGELGRLGQRRANLLAVVGTETGVKLAEVQPQLKQLSKLIEAASAKRDAIEGASGHARMLADMRRDLFKGSRVSLEDAAKLRTLLLARFDALDLDTQRALVRDLLDVVVSGGRGADRVSITHLVVQSLNSPVVQEEQLGKELMSFYGL